MKNHPTSPQGLTSKALSLGAQVKMSDEGSGYLEGYGSTFYGLDDVGDVVMAGAFADSLGDFEVHGFHPDTHDWKFSDVIGYPEEAKEDEQGLWFRMAFHGTDDAQRLRVKLMERVAAGKSVKLSIGFYIKESEIVLRKDYETRLAEVIPADKLSVLMEAVKSRPYVRLIHKAELAEISPVPRPANRAAAATVIKSAQTAAAGTPERKSEYLGDYIEMYIALAGANEILSALHWKLYCAIFYSNAEEFDANLKEIEAAFAEGGVLAVSVIRLLLATEGDSEKSADALVDAFTAKMGAPDPDRGLRFETRQAIARDAIRRGIEDWEAMTNLSAKDGDALTTGRRERLTAFAGELRSALTRTEALLTKAPAGDDDRTAKANREAALIREQLLFTQSHH